MTKIEEHQGENTEARRMICDDLHSTFVFVSAVVPLVYHCMSHQLDT